MATVVATDYAIAANGDITYTVIEFHRWLGDLMDQAQATNDILDITDATASERSTDNIITLLPPYNIDDTVAQHLYDGSIVQKGGDEIYDGILVFAPAGDHPERCEGNELLGHWLQRQRSGGCLAPVHAQGAHGGCRY